MSDHCHGGPVRSAPERNEKIVFSFLKKISACTKLSGPVGTEPKKISASTKFSGMAEFWRWPESQGSASEQVGEIVVIDRLIEAPAYNQTQTFGAEHFMLC